MSIETLSLILFVVIFASIISMLYIYNEIILPTNTENGNNGEIKFLPSNQIKQMVLFLSICKEKKIHNIAKIITQVFLYGLPIFITALAILMAFNI